MKLSCNSCTFLLLSFEQLSAHVGKSLFCLLAVGNVRKDRKSAAVTLDLDQFGRTEGCPNLTIFPPNLNLQVSHVPLGEKVLPERGSVVGIYPKVDIQWAPSRDFTTSPPG